MEEYLDKHQVARKFGLKPSSVDYYRRKKLLPSFIVGKHHRYIWSDVLKAITPNQEG